MPEPYELGDLLELLHRADAPVQTVRAVYRIWRHDERAAAAWHAEIEEERRRGAAISTYGPARDSEEPPEREKLLRVWRSGDRLREEHEAGSRDGCYGVRRGNLWWQWDPRVGAISNEDDPKVGSGIGQELSVMLDPTPLLGALRFRVLGRSQLAGRATVTAEAVPRPSDPGRHPRSFELHELGSGADRYTLEVDAERGVLLGVIALRDDEPFHRVTTLEIAFDEPIAEERFEFQPPEGEEIGPVRMRRPEHMPLTEAQRRAPFTVLIPARVPTDWQLHCDFVGPSDRPPAPAVLLLQYRSDSGHESVNLSEFSAAERPSIYDELARGDGWEEVIRGGATVRVTKRGQFGHGQVQAFVERDGTFVFLMSESLSGEQLTRVAAALTPAPDTSGI